MMRVPQMEPITNLQRAYQAVLAKLASGPVVLSNYGRAAAVLVSVEEWDRQADELDRLKRLVQADGDFAAMRAGQYTEG